MVFLEVFLLLDCRLFAFTLYCFLCVRVWEWDGNVLDWVTQNGSMDNSGLPLPLLACLLHSVLRCCWLGGRKGIWPVENWVVRCWHGYLSGARCRLAYGAADATATHCLYVCVCVCVWFVATSRRSRWVVTRSHWRAIRTVWASMKTRIHRSSTRMARSSASTRGVVGAGAGQPHPTTPSSELQP